MPVGFPRLYAAASLKRGAGLHGGRLEACFPRLYAAASLKRHSPALWESTAMTFSAALCRGLIEAPMPRRCFTVRSGFSAALCRGLIEASQDAMTTPTTPASFPRLYAAASLKLGDGELHVHGAAPFSAALCRGLIEAAPRHCELAGRAGVFRGFMPRPH